MTYDEAIQFLYDLQLFGAHFGLENTHRLADLAGNPQNQLKFIHVAGTNGKGSVCSMLETVYRTTGLRTGLYSSPHLIHFGERIRVNNQLLHETQLIALTERLSQLLAEGAVRNWWPKTNEPSTSDRGHPTFFEVVTVMALIHFAEQRCEIVLWETGLGGRLDATNIVTPLASVITNIALEHSAYLGDTIEKIAAEKSGIIKPGVPVFTGSEDQAALKVIREVAANRKAPFTAKPDDKSTELAAAVFPDSYQQTNARLALTVINGLRSTLPVNEGIMKRPLRDFNFPGRLQRITRGKQTIVIDGAHNPASIRALKESVNGKTLPTIFGCFEDKDLETVINELLPLVSRLYLVPVDSPRSASTDALKCLVQKFDADLPVQIFGSVEEAIDATAGEPELLVMGSLYLAGEALNHLSSTNDTNNSEQALNDWTVSSSK